MGDVSFVEATQRAQRRETMRKPREVNPSEIIPHLESLAGTISKEVLIPLVDFSLAIQSSLSAQKDIPRISSQFVKACVQEILEMRENNLSINEIDKRISDMCYCLTVLVSLPSKLLEIKDLPRRKSFKQLFINLYVLQKESPPLSAKVKDDFAYFKNKIQLETGNYWQGILGETIAFILLEDAGFKPKLSTPEEDLHNIDMFGRIITPKGEKEFPVQVKTRLTDPNVLFSVERNIYLVRPDDLLLLINVEGFLRRREMLKELLSTNQPRARSSSTIDALEEKVMKMF